jgi:hypothetical protein
MKLISTTSTGWTRRCPAAQLALGWVLARGDDIVPIPGTIWGKSGNDAQIHPHSTFQMGANLASIFDFAFSHEFAHYSRDKTGLRPDLWNFTFCAHLAVKDLRRMKE